MRSRNEIFVLAVALSLLPGYACAQAATSSAQQAGKTARKVAAKPQAAACNVEGVWQLVSANWGGRDQPMTGTRERKIVSRGHWMWLSADAKRDTLPLRTAADSLRYEQVTGGAGTYTLSGNTYTEHLDMLFLPTWEGRDVPAKCETTGNTWIHTWHFDDTTAVVEHWRRIR